jgi:phosphatidylinositol phospholipase C gamma-1
MLSRISIDGAFLVRTGERVFGSFAITFRAEKKIKHCLIKQEGRLFVIGTVQFESLVDLICFYEKHPLYRKVCLKLPVNEELLSRQRTNGSSDTDAAYIPESGYTDPCTSITKVRALYDYTAQRDDELTLVKNCIVTNVQKKDAGWWKGDYGGRKQHWFPANFVQEIEASQEPTEGGGANAIGGEEDGGNTELMPLGDLQKGSIDIIGADVEIRDNPVRPVGVTGLEWLVRIKTPSSVTPFEVAAPSQSEALEWAAKIRDTSRSASYREENNRKKERALRIARELSNLVVYCRSVVFNYERNMKRDPRIHQEMSSFPETKAEKLMLSSLEHNQMFLWYHEIQLSRVYPKAQRVDSANYNPVPMWNVGSQMTALNFQTGDKPMQLNQAKFMQNGSCGYVLRPEYMFDAKYVPTDPTTLPPDLTIIIGMLQYTAGSNDHFVVVVVLLLLPRLVQFDERPLGGANFQF